MYSGIPSVVADIAGLAMTRSDVAFVVGDAVVPSEVVRDCIAENSGWPLQAAALLADPWGSALALAVASERSVAVYANLPGRLHARAKLQVAYDLVPLLLPDHTEPSTRGAYNLAFRGDFTQADHIVAISNATRLGLIGYLRVASDRISVCSPTVGVPAPASVDLQLSRKLGLVIGTVEPRKNIELLLELLRT